jgi:lysozyme
MYLKPYLCPARQRAMALLEWELNHCLPKVRRLCPALKDWGEQATGAILDFAFNCGTGALQSSTLRKRINADDLDGAKTELMRWVRGGGKVLPGLVKRRAAEIALLG